MSNAELKIHKQLRVPQLTAVLKTELTDRPSKRVITTACFIHLRYILF